MYIEIFGVFLIILFFISILIPLKTYKSSKRFIRTIIIVGRYVLIQNW